MLRDGAYWVANHLVLGSNLASGWVHRFLFLSSLSIIRILIDVLAPCLMALACVKVTYSSLIHPLHLQLQSN